MNVVRTIPIASGLLAISLGSLYAFGFFGPTEAEVRAWGKLCAAGGLTVLFIGWNVRKLAPVLRWIAV